MTFRFREGPEPEGLSESVDLSDVVWSPVNPERWGALPLDEPRPPLHSRYACWRCGHRPDWPVSLKRVIVRATRDYGWQCVDTIACERRYYDRHRRV